MAIVTTATLPQQQVIGVVTASVNCLRKHSFEFDQAIMEACCSKRRPRVLAR